MKQNKHIISLRTASSLAGAAGAVLLLTAATVGAPPGERTKPFQTAINLEGYRLVWSDEFAGSALDTGAWHYRTDSKMNSTQLAGNVSVANGMLRLALKKERAGDKNYTGGGVITKRHFAHGYYEARIKMPASRGWHTSFWMAGFDDMKPGQGATCVSRTRSSQPAIPTTSTCGNRSENHWVGRAFGHRT